MHETIAVLKSLETGDSSAIMRLVSAQKFIQHNPTMPDGRQALIDALPHVARAGAKVRTVRTLADGSFVVHHSEYVLAGKSQIGFDVFRLEDGKVVEHWESRQELPGPNQSGHTMVDGAVEVTDLGQTAANKELVRKLITDVFMGHRFPGLPEYISRTTYLQHNPNVADGLGGLMAAAPLLAKFAYREIHQVLGQGNFVLAMSEIAFDGQDAVVYDLFRVEDGKIVEHWDVLEVTPPRAEWKNANGKL